MEGEMEMSDVRKFAALFALASVPSLTAGCGPTLSTQVRTETALAPGNTGILDKDGLSVQVPNLTAATPEELLAEGTACEPDGKIVIDPLTNGPKVVKIYATGPDIEAFQVKLANNTDHVVRLQGAVIRLFDPAENPIEPLSKEDAIAMASRPSMLLEHGVCATSAGKVKDALAAVRFLGPNTELLPGTTTTGYLLFQPRNRVLPGAWKLSLYEIPVKVDAAGNVVAKTKFDFAYIRKKFEDTYSQDFWGARKLMSSKEVP
jgi:hypothetical protein